MKGVVFTEFLEMVEQKFGMEMVNALIENNDLSSDGVYSAVGTYHHSEMVSLVVDLGKRSGITIPDLLKAFGAYLFQTFKTGYPERCLPTRPMGLNSCKASTRKSTWRC